MTDTNVKVEGESKEKLIKHANEYKTPKKVSQSSRSIQTSRGDTKEKFIRTRVFSNGVVKNSICGLKKNGKWIFGTDK